MDVRPGFSMTNFLGLLEFWKRTSHPPLSPLLFLCLSLSFFFGVGYYRYRGRDCAGIEFSTCIPFAEWRRFVLRLCGPGMRRKRREE
jgi:hypothetical protein